MTKKNLGAFAGLAVVCGFTAWIVGRQIAPKPADAHTTTTAAASTGASPLLKKTLSQPATSLKAPANPTHEKAFLEEQLKANPGHPPILLRLAELERSDGKLSDARQHLEQALKSDPTLIDARLELSLVCYQLGDAAEAEKQNKAILSQDSKQPDALYNLGAIYANQNRLAEARRSWADAVKYGPETASGKNAATALQKLQ